MTNATETERPSPKVIDAKTFWRTLGERAIGATIVTAQGADGPAGFLGLSATHVCADPPSMLVSIDRKTSALAAVLHGHHFAINYLGRDARAIADMFAGKTAAKGSARFEPGRWGTLTTGAPVFNDAIGGSIAGLFTAAFLRRIGWEVDIYERRAQRRGRCGRPPRRRSTSKSS